MYACMYVCVFQLTCPVSTMTFHIFSLIKYLIFSVLLTLRRWPPLLFYRGHRRYWIEIHTYFCFSIYIPHPAYLICFICYGETVLLSNANPLSINLTTIPFHFRGLNIHFLAVWHWQSPGLGPFSYLRSSASASPFIFNTPIDPHLHTWFTNLYF